MSRISAVAPSDVWTVGVMLYVLYRTEARVEGAMIGREDSRDVGILENWVSAGHQMFIGEVLTSKECVV